MFKKEPTCKLNDRRDWITLLHSDLPYTIHLHTSKKPTQFFYQKNPQLPESYLREVLKIALSCGHRSGIDASKRCISIPTAVCKCSPASASALSDPPSGTAHLPPHASRVGRAFVQGSMEAAAGWAALTCPLIRWYRHKKWIGTSVCLNLCSCSHTAKTFSHIQLYLSWITPVSPTLQINSEMFCFLAPCKCFWIWQQE